MKKVDKVGIMENQPPRTMLSNGISDFQFQNAKS